MKGESNYLDMKELLYNLDSNSVQITGAIDILDSYFEQKALNQFSVEKDKLNHWLLVEFMIISMVKVKSKANFKKDKDILKALDFQ